MLKLPSRPSPNPGLFSLPPLQSRHRPRRLPPRRHWVDGWRPARPRLAPPPRRHRPRRLPRPRLPLLPRAWGCDAALVRDAVAPRVLDEQISFDGGPLVRRRIFERADQGPLVLVEPAAGRLATGLRALHPDPNCGYGRILAVRGDGTHAEMVCTTLSGVEMIEPAIGARALPSTIEASAYVAGGWRGIDVTETVLALEMGALQSLCDGPDGTAAFSAPIIAAGISPGDVIDFECAASISFYFGYMPDMNDAGQLIVSRRVTLTDLLQCRADALQVRLPDDAPTPAATP